MTGLNPIEHLWDNVDQRVRRRPVPPSDSIQLRQALIHEWNNITQAEISTHLSVLCANDARQSFMLKVVTTGVNLGFW